MGVKLKAGDVLGRCPQCSNAVAVYAMGGRLRVRAHTRNTNTGTRWRDVPCPVTGVDGAEALSRVMASQEADIASADKEVVVTLRTLDNARARAAKAREQRDAYAAQVAELKARVAGKGGTP